MRAGDFAQDQLAEAMADERALRGVVVPLLEQARDRRTIAFCVNVAHAVALAGVLNQYRPGCARAVSGETDDTLREQLLAEHSRGEFQFLVNCDLLVEGYDCPEVACVAMVRPTKSWARYVQCAGRGLRPAAWIGKRDCLILDFTGTAGKHALIGPADCLRAANENIPDDLRAEIERLLESGQLELEKVVKHAADEVRARRVAMRLDAVVNYHSEHIDPFIGRDPGVATRSRNTPEYRVPPTERQLTALEQCGVTTSKLPPTFTMGDASHLLTRLATRNKAGLAPYKQAKKIRDQTKKFCTLDTENMTAETAKRLYSELRDGGWHFTAIENAPEVLAARERSKQARLANSGGFR
jgi:superfamily II DNA or RNA helicase